MRYKSNFVNTLAICMILLCSSCQRPINNDVSVNDTKNSSLNTSNSSEIVEDWLIPILSEYLADESTVQEPPVPPITPTQNIAINERLEIPITAAVLDIPSFNVSNGFTASYVNHSNSEVIFDLQVGDNVTLEHSNDEIQVDVLNSVGQLVGRQKYVVTTTFADAEVIVSLEGRTLESFNSAIAGKGYTIKATILDKDNNVQQVIVDIGTQSSGKALRALHDLITSIPPSQKVLRTQGLASDIRAIAGPNYAYKSDGHRGSRTLRILMPTCDVKDNLEEFASEWDPINDLVNLTNASEAHERGFYGDDIVVVLLDSGIDDEDVFDCINTPEKDGHGTHVKNIVKALAPNVTIVSKRVFNEDGIASIDNLINTNDLIQALKEIEKDYLIPGKRVILNMSFSAPVHPHHGHDLMLWGALADLYDFYNDQLLVVASAGNHGLDEEYKNEIFYPAGFSRSFRSVQESFEFIVPRIPNVISVGSAGLKNNELKSSDYNPATSITDLLAYGVKLCKSDLNNTLCADNVLTGSSFSAPVLSAIAALNWQRCSQQPSSQIRNLLTVQSTFVPDSNLRLVNYSHDFDCDAQAVIPGPKATQLVTGNQFGCLLLKENSEVYCWGESPAQFEKIPNYVGGVTEQPELVKRPQGIESWSSIAAEEEHLCALSSTGQLYCWGRDPSIVHNFDPNDPNSDFTLPYQPYKLLNPTEVAYWKQISSRCGIANNDQAYCWEFDWAEQSGPVSVPSRINTPDSVNSWKEITNGCGIGNDDQAYCWWYYTYDSLLLSELIYSINPVKISNPFGVSRWKHISQQTPEFTCAISTLDQAYCWGVNKNFGNGNSRSAGTTPTLVTRPDGVNSWSTLTTKSTLTCGIANTGDAYCWGDIECYNFSDNPDCISSLVLPAQVAKPLEVSGWSLLMPPPSITNFICALTSDAEAYCWGNNVFGQTGNGEISNTVYTPTPVAEIID